VRVVNVKPADRLKDPKIVSALAWPGDLFTDHGWCYEAWSGEDPMVLDKCAVPCGLPAAVGAGHGRD